MDPYGNYDCFYIQARYWPRTRVEEIAGLMPYRLRVENSYSNHPYFPLSVPLMKRVDDRDTGLDYFDFIVMADINPAVFSFEDVRNLRSFVEVGRGIIIFGGAMSFDKSCTAYTGFEELLPVKIKRKRHELKNATPELTGQFKKFRNDLGDFGSVDLWHEVEPSPDAEVLATVDGKPLVVAKECGLGRIIVIAGSPDEDNGYVGQGRICKDKFFFSDGYANLLGLCYSFAMKRDQDLQVCNFRPETSGIKTGDAVKCDVRPENLKSAKININLSKAGDEIVLDRDPQFAEIKTDSYRIQKGKEQKWVWQSGKEPESAGAYRLRVTMDGPTISKYDYEYLKMGFYGITVPEHGYNAKTMRTATFNVEKKTGIRAYPVGFHNTVCLDGELEINIEKLGTVPNSAKLSAELLRKDNAEDRVEVVKDITLPKTLKYKIPDLQKDDYLLILTVTNPPRVHRTRISPFTKGGMKGGFKEGGQLIDKVTIPVCVVDKLREEETVFRAVTHSGGNSTKTYKAWFEELVKRGFNGFTIDPSRLNVVDQRKTDFHNAMLSYWQEIVQKNGHIIWGEYSKTVILQTHNWRDKEGADPTKPYPFSSEHRKKTDAFIDDRMNSAKYMPRLVSMEIVDEPHIYKANVDRSKTAMADYKKKYGYEKPTWEEYLKAKDCKRLDYFNDIVDYASAAFKSSYDSVNAWLKKRENAFPQIHHVYAQGAVHNPAISVFDQLEWSKHCHTLEFDSYPWQYGNFRCWKEIRMGETKYMFAYYRVLCDYLNKRFGFFVENDDYYYPQEINPPNHSSELMYFAIANGTKRLHTMLVANFGTRGGMHEKEQIFGNNLRRVMNLSCLLSVSKPIRTGLGVLNAWSHRIYNPPEHSMPEGFEGIGFYSMRLKPYDTIYPNWVEPLNGYEAICRAYGYPPDVVDERILEPEMKKYKAFVLLNAVKTMMANSFEIISDFVKKGGILITDGVPDTTTDGKNDKRFSSLAGGWEFIAEDVKVCYAEYGRGKVMFIDHELHDAISLSYEQDKPHIRENIVKAISGFLKDNGIVAETKSSDPERIGAYELVSGATRIITVINHAEGFASAKVVVRNKPGFGKPMFIMDMCYFRSIDFVATKDGVEFEVALPTRESVIVGIYEDIPARTELKLDRDTVAGSEKWGWECSIFNKQGKRVKGNYPVRVQVFTPSGKKQERFERFVPAKDGLLKGEFKMPINAEKGRWLISLYNLLTFEKIEKNLNVK